MGEVAKAVPSSHKFQTAVIHAPRYRYTAFYPQTNSTSLQTSATNTNSVIFTIPNIPINFSKSWISWTDREEAATNANKTVTCKAIDCFPIQQIQLATRTGKVLVEVNEFKQWSQIVRWLNMDIQKYRTCNIRDALTTTHGARGDVNKPRATVYNGPPANNAISRGLEESMYCVVSGNGEGMTLPYRVFLGDACPYTLLALPQDMIFREDLLLKVTFCPYDQVRWAINNGSSDPNDGPAIKTSATAGLGSFLTDIQLNLAVQTNADLVNALVKEMGANFILSIPFIYSERQTYAQTVTHVAPTKSISMAHGQLLRWVLTCGYDGADALNTANDCSNEEYLANTRRITSYNTQLNSENLQPGLVVCNNADDYKLNYPYMMRSPIGLDIQTYNSRWFHLDAFDDTRGAGNGQSTLAKESIVGGIPLYAQGKYHTFNATLPAVRSSTIIQWFCVQRTLNIKSNGMIDIV